MSELRFEWDERKNTENQRKHGVSFEFILLGLSAAVRLLVVCHSYRASDTVIRIISARKATATERETYRQRWTR